MFYIQVFVFGPFHPVTSSFTFLLQRSDKYPSCRPFQLEKYPPETPDKLLFIYNTTIIDRLEQSSSPHLSIPHPSFRRVRGPVSAPATITFPFQFSLYPTSEAYI